MVVLRYMLWYVLKVVVPVVPGRNGDVCARPDIVLRLALVRRTSRCSMCKGAGIVGIVGIVRTGHEVGTCDKKVWCIYSVCQFVRWDGCRR